MRSVSFSDMKDAITVQKLDGIHVSYHVSEEFEIHLNRITPGSVQEQYYHTRVDECLFITKGMLTCRWLEDGAERTKKIRGQETARVGSSVHTFVDEPEEDVEFAVFRLAPGDRNKRETIKSDKAAVGRRQGEGKYMVRWARGAAGVVSLTALLWGCSPGQVDEQAAEEQQRAAAGLEGRDVQRVTQTASPEPEGTGIAVNPSGTVLSERIPIPSGFQRTDAGEGSFQDCIRSYSLKPDGSLMALCDGSEEGNQTAHQAVFALLISDNDLRQCVDSLIRMYGEYLWVRGTGDEIAFHLTNGFLMDYPSWREGNRLSVDGNQVLWVKKASYGDLYKTFLLYMRYVMVYADTLSLDNECAVIDISPIKAGDMFIKGGSPGHCVMVANVAVNEDGNVCFLLAQGYMSAQDFHILNNPLHMDNPQYYASEPSCPLKTPEYVFQEGSLERWYFGGFLQRFG